jgi:outer membrane autotransporter protein
MNHFHRVIFNRALGVRQVVSEIANSGRGAGSEGNTSSSGSGLCQAPRLSALAAACLLAWCAAPQAQAATCNAATSAELTTCISSATAGDTVNLTASITLSANLGVIDKDLTINGNGNTLDGANTYRGFFVGAGTYTGATMVNAGTLSVNGAITSATTVNSGAALGGNGSVGNVNVLAGGVLAPGNSIGTLTVNGNLTFAPGSIYRVETDAAGNADRVNVVGAPGTLTINGGTVDVQAGVGNYARNTRYTILTSTGATTGAFTGVTSNLAFLTPTLSYLPNGVTLNLLAENAPVYSAVAQTPNQTSVANYLSSFANTPGNSAAAALIQQIDNLSASQARVAFDSMSGSPHAAASQVALAMGRSFSATLAMRTGSTVSTGLSNSGSSTAGLKAIKLANLSPALLTRSGDVVSDSPLRVAAAEQAGAEQSGPALQSAGGLWGQAMGTGGRTGSDGSGPASRYRANGFVFGYDQPLSAEWLAGAALAYNKAQWDASTNGAAPASGSISSPQAGLYARYAAGPWQVRLDGTYSDHHFSTDRTVTIGNATSIARSSHGGTEWAFAAQAEYSLPAGDWDIRPLAGLRHARLSEDGFTETGAGAANLTVNARRSQNTVASLGMKLIRPLNPGKADAGALELRAVASHLMGDNDSPLSSRLAGQAGSFTTAGTPLKRTALTLGSTLSGQLSRGLSAYADAAYEYRGSGQNAFQFVAGLKLAW